MTNFKQIAALALALCALLAWAQPARAEAQADAVAAARRALDGTIADVLAALGDESLDLPAKRKRIEEIALARFDFRTTAKLVLKRDWRRFDKTQRAEFVVAFREYLAGSYGSRISRYNQEAVDVTGARLEPRGDVTVLTRIRGGEADGVAADYRLRKQRRSGEWLIIDVVIEGISLVSNFRSQFAEMISSGGPTKLLTRLQQINADRAVGREVDLPPGLESATSGGS